MALSCPCTSLISLSMTPLLAEDLTGGIFGHGWCNDSVDDRLHGGLLIRLEYDFRRLVTKLFIERDDALEHMFIYGPFSPTSTLHIILVSRSFTTRMGWAFSSTLPMN